MAKNTNPFGLTKRELEVLTLVREGLDSTEVANALYCSKRTVDFHLLNAYDKIAPMQKMNRTKAVRELEKTGYAFVEVAA